MLLGVHEVHRVRKTAGTLLSPTNMSHPMSEGLKRKCTARSTFPWFALVESLMVLHSSQCYIHSTRPIVEISHDYAQKGKTQH